jgi:hypothetical protein
MFLEIVLGIEFWLSFTLGELIIKLKKMNTMNIFKTIIVGVGAIM